jgi:hypothetical protein
MNNNFPTSIEICVSVADHRRCYFPRRAEGALSPGGRGTPLGGEHRGGRNAPRESPSPFGGGGRLSCAVHAVATVRVVLREVWGVGYEI